MQIFLKEILELVCLMIYRLSHLQAGLDMLAHNIIYRAVQKVTLIMSVFKELSKLWTCT